MRILASQENVSDTELLCVADTMLSLGTEVLAHNPALEPLSIPSLSMKSDDNYYTVHAVEEPFFNIGIILATRQSSIFDQN